VLLLSCVEGGYSLSIHGSICKIKESHGITIQIQIVMNIYTENDNEMKNFLREAL
jgi:hypothetical protein